MVTSEQSRLFEQVIHKIDPQSEMLHVWELKGGVSAQVTALEIKQPNGQTSKMVVRRYGATDLAHNPQIAADEYKLLGIAQSAGLAVPTPLLFDQTGEIFPTPYVVIEYVEGTTEFAPADGASFILQLATQLSLIHKINPSVWDLSFLPQQQERYANILQTPPAHLDDSLNERRLRETLQTVWPLPQRNPSVLLHGDFWPGNVLWKDDKLAAIIDWEDAAVGDPLADLANSRLELLWALGLDAMQGFTQQYRTLMPHLDYTHLSYWDLCVALKPASKMSEWGLDKATEQKMREQLGWFVAEAFKTL